MSPESKPQAPYKSSFRKSGAHASTLSQEGFAYSLFMYYPLLLFFALLMLLGFLHQYPQAAFPLRAVFISSGMLLVALGLMAAGWRSAVMPRSALVTTACLTAFILWCIIRNHLSPTPAQGRGFLSMLLQGFWVFTSVQILLTLEKSPGASIPVALPIELRHESYWNYLSLRTIGVMFFAIMLIVVSLQGIYQYFIGYERHLKTIMDLGLYGGDDLHSSGIRHALRERRVSAGFGNPNLLAVFLGMALPFLIWLFFESKKNIHRFFLITVIAASMFTLILTRSRGGILCYAFAGIAAMAASVLNMKNGIRTILHRRSMLFAIIVIIVVIGFFIIQHGTSSRDIRGGSFLERITNAATIRERIYYLQTGGGIIGENPFFGVGPGGYEMYYLKHRMPQARESRYAHNMPVQMWAETGIVGLVLFGLFCFQIIKYSTRFSRDGITAFMLVALLTFLFHSLLDIGFYHESLYVDFCLLAALITGDRPSWETPESKKRYIAGPTKSYMVFILPVACSLLLFPSLVLRPLLSASWKQYGDAAAQDDQDWTSALEYYQKALGHEPDDPWIHQRIGRAWFHLGDPRKAQIHLVKAVEINPLSASLKDELAALYKATFRIDEAVLWQTKAVQAYPFKAEYHYRLARYLMEKGQKDAAIKAAREAERVELDPAAKEAFRQYALSIAQ